MSFLFDASSIFEALIGENVGILSDNYTLEIARYELGNILWRSRALTKDINDGECIRLANLIKNVLKLLNVINIGCCEVEILKIAEELKMTFYDSSYVFIARERGIPLITEDEQLRRKAEGYIKVMNVEELVKSRGF
ncbi:MAG: type II toxin-antitoxin system VapC family toxin [Candidatus Bathyarchaeia archaeon]